MAMHCEDMNVRGANDAPTRDCGGASAAEFRQALPGDVEHVVAILGQQVQGADNLGDVARFGMIETRAIKGFEQVAGSADALSGGVEDLDGVGLGIDDQHRGFAVAGFKRLIAFSRCL